jgi:hypothetical protein
VLAAAASWTQLFQEGLTGLTSVVIFVLGGLFAERLIREGRRHRWRDRHDEAEPGVAPKDPPI